MRRAFVVALLFLVAGCDHTKVFAIIPGGDFAYTLPAASSAPSTIVTSATLTANATDTSYACSLDYTGMAPMSDAVVWVTLDGAQDAFLDVDKSFPAPASGTESFTLETVTADENAPPEHAAGPFEPDSMHDVQVSVGTVATAGPPRDLGEIKLAAGALPSTGGGATCGSDDDCGAFGDRHCSGAKNGLCSPTDHLCHCCEVLCNPTCSCNVHCANGCECVESWCVFPQGGKPTD